ncbi:ABC-2 transporter permease [Streptacidiphilus fuscans]|uniref:DUF3533 domain-containing protein n=1 Tax=Streptacidiphilus fuscans TaxID=2789292 RepID=A0A931AYK3_9ACTN|nr:DUF3533 domain-containing protein [Streptacidiphilus fuscans]MBF9067209.1 DUF3533 domain-containing protein [Streptacidiphilus fuscans]
MSRARDERAFTAELRDAVTARAALLVVGVLLLQFGFILSYVGALHHPTPHQASIGVVGPPAVQTQVVAQLNALPGSPLDARPVAGQADAVQLMKEQKLYSAFVPNVAGTQDTLLVASAASSSLATAIGKVVTSVDAAQHRTVAIKDVVPVASGDQGGLTSFYLAVGWCVGGYLVASILGISAGARPANRHRAVIRLGTLALYSIAAGLGGAVIVGPVLNALPAGILALWGVGSLLVFAVGAFTMAMQCFLGVIGIGGAVLIFVILGNPSAGGVLAPPMLPPFWRAIGPWLPNGAGTSLNRSFAYFDGTKTTFPWLVLTVWALVGVVLTLLVSVLKHTNSESAPVT